MNVLIGEDELSMALKKIEALKRDKRELLDMNAQLINQVLAGTQEYKKRFLVKIGNSIQFKNVREVALFSAEDKYCFLHTFGSISKKYLVEHTLEELSGKLLDPSKYFRISRKHIISINAIKEIRCTDNQNVIIPIVPFNETLTISRSRFSDFKNWLDS